jgi:putative endonuclease
MNSSQSEIGPESSVPKTAHLELGRRGEQLAAAYLEQQGYAIVATNFTLPVGRNLRGAIVNAEIDLVAYEGPTLCFIEVKTRASDWFAPPQANVDLRKQRQIVRAARAYRRMLGLEASPYRYDVVSIVFPEETDKSSSLQINILRGYWTEDKLRKRRWQERYYD